MTVKTRIIRIGNSQGVRIRKPLLEQSGITDEVELEIGDGKIIIFDVFLVSLDPTRGDEIKKTRPCLVISPDEMNRLYRRPSEGYHALSG